MTEMLWTCIGNHKSRKDRTTDMRMMTLASGSSGNCIYIGSENTHILIDAGITRKRIMEGLAKVNIKLSEISAIFVTHEHSDHVKGIGVISRNDEIPIYCTNGTKEGICRLGGMGEIDKSLLHTVAADKEYLVGDLCIHPFTVSHDAKEPVAYTVQCSGKKIGIVTDLGCYDDYIVQNMKGCHSILVEANHDINLLQVGSYPYYLKQRILSNKGHLSNELCGRLIDALLHKDISNIILGHLSKENNYDKLAFETVKCEIDLSASDYKSNDFNISVAARTTPSCMVEV